MITCYIRTWQLLALQSLVPPQSNLLLDLFALLINTKRDNLEIFNNISLSSNPKSFRYSKRPMHNPFLSPLCLSDYDLEYFRFTCSQVCFCIS